jgi:hypothetical protein
MNLDFFEWLIKEVEIKDISHLDRKFDQHYMTTPVFTKWFADILGLKEKIYHEI